LDPEHPVSPAALRRGALLAACVLGAALAMPALARRAQAAVSTRDVPWLHETDFAADPALHAVLGQTVILDLERLNRRFAASDFRIVLDREVDLTLCIPPDAPYVRWVRIARVQERRVHGGREGHGRNVFWIRRGAPCHPIRLRVGAYEIRVVHDARAVPEGGQTAFFRLDGPATGGGLSFTIDSSGCPGCDLTGVDLSGQSFPAADFSRATFAQAKLDGADFQSARFDDASLVGASITGANLSATFLSCANLSGLDVVGLLQPARDGVVYMDGSSTPRLVRVDPPTGVRATVTGNGVGATYGALVDVAVLADGSLLTADLFDVSRNGDSTLYRVEPARGVTTLVSNNSRGTGPAFGTVSAVGQAGDGSYLVFGEAGPGGPPALFRVDPATGDRQIVSGAGTGSGPGLALFGGFAVDTDGTLVVPASNTNTLLRVDPATGNRSVVTGSGTGSGTQLSAVKDVVLTSAGTIVVSDSNRLVSVDPATGNRSVLSSSSVGSGPRLRSPFGVVEAGDGSLVLVDASAASIVRVDAATGDRTVLSSASVGGGTGIGAPLYLTRFPVAPSIAPDFSCRLDLSGATLDPATLAPESWRYMDLTGATISGVAGAVLSSQSAPLDLSGTLLSGVDLSGAILDYVNLGCFEGTVANGCPTAVGTRMCSTLQGTSLVGASLVGACLANASLQGASLTDSNLAAADLTGAKLLGLPNGDAASLAGAFMPDATLDGADLTGVNANYVSFYNANAKASATGATMTGARFTNAYLVGADFDTAEAESTAWTQSVLMGANFSNAHLEKNATSDEATDFTGAFLEGANFSNAAVTDADFTSSYWDLTGFGTVKLVVVVPQPSLEFTGYWNAPGAPECVEAKYTAPSMPPLTTTTNRCPNGNKPTTSCTFSETPTTSIDNAIPQVSPSLPASCTEVDFEWQLGGQ
jgi:uncharacterized protein YjbI with pentapeptide repeats